MGRIGESVSGRRKSLRGGTFLGLRKAQRLTINLSLFTVFAIAVMGFCWAIPAHATDKLIVKDSTGTNTVFSVDDSGTVDASEIGLGTTNPVSRLSVTDQSSTINRGAVISQNTTDVVSAAFIMRKSRGTETSPSAVSSGDYIGMLQFRPFDGSSYLRSAIIQAQVDGPVTTGSVPTDLLFCASSFDEYNPISQGAVRMIIKSTGNVGIGTTTPTQKLDVNDTGIRIEQSMTPASSTDTCNQGQIAWDANYVYVCVAANTWKRAALSSW